MKRSRTCWLLSALALMPALAVCAQGEEATIRIRMPADRYKEASGPVERISTDTEGRVIRPRDEKGWLAYEVEVAVAGRYRCDVRVSARTAKGATLWLEDHVDNTDGRPCELTSPLVVSQSEKKSAFTTVTKVGSPLNAGTHRMKLHFSGSSIHLAWFRFTLIKRHQLTPTTMVQRTEGDEWQLVWSDEFDGTGLPDSTKWTADIGNWGWGNREPQYYTEGRTENARQENGHLVIEARKNDMGQAWTSARLTTRGKVSFIYGKIEIRAKVPVGNGCWAAGWFLGDAYRDELSWPYCGEIDILEAVGREIDDDTGDGINHATCHTRAYYFKQGNHITSTTRVPKMGTDFHIYAAEWAPDGMKIFLDGKHYYTYDKTANELEWPFNNPQVLILNLAIGGGMGGAIDPKITSQKFIIDHVKVYGRK